MIKKIFTIDGHRLSTETVDNVTWFWNSRIKSCYLSMLLFVLPKN